MILLLGGMYFVHSIDYEVTEAIYRINGNQELFDCSFEQNNLIGFKIETGEKVILPLPVSIEFENKYIDTLRDDISTWEYALKENGKTIYFKKVEILEE